LRYRLGGAGRDIGVGADGSVWVIGGNDQWGGWSIYKWNEQSQYLSQISGSALQISVDGDGNPWVTDSYNEIHSGQWR